MTGEKICATLNILNISTKYQLLASSTQIKKIKKIGVNIQKPMKQEVSKLWTFIGFLLYGAGDNVEL